MIDWKTPSSSILNIGDYLNRICFQYENQPIQLSWKISVVPFNDKQTFRFYGFIRAMDYNNLPLSVQVNNELLAAEKRMPGREQGIAEVYAQNIDEKLGFYLSLETFAKDPGIIKINLYDCLTRLAGKGFTHTFYNALDQYFCDHGFDLVFGVNSRSNHDYFVKKLGRNLLEPTNTDPRILTRIINCDIEHYNLSYITYKILQPKPRDNHTS